MNQTVTRTQMTEASLVVLPNLKEAVADKSISPTTLWNIASMEAFISNLSGPHVDVLRIGMKMIKNGHTLSL